MLTLIADSGSTKTDWCVLSSDGTHRMVSTQGINPVHQDLETIERILVDELMVNMGEAKDDVAKVFFYGAGCTGSFALIVNNVLKELFGNLTSCEVSSDLLGAARALCGDEEGIACILGTGSNSCLYDGKGIVANIPPLGYILGDEGSGAVLGRKLLNALFKGEFSSTLRDMFLKEMSLDYGMIIEKVYRQPMANRFLASLSPFISRHISDHHELEELVVEHFREFLRKNVVRYMRNELPVNAVGSIAWYYRSQLMKAVSAESLKMGTILKSPIEGLLEYHKMS